MAKFAGKRYKLVSNENLDAYLDTVEAPEEIKAIAKIVKPSLELVVNGDTYILKTIIENNVRETSFKIGQEFEQTIFESRKVPTTFTLEGDNKIIETHRAEKPSKVIREFSNDTVKITMTADNVTAIRTFKAE